MEETRVKRRKISRGEDDYLPGNITKIELHNFMTFSDLVCKPGSRLNLVIGPNGSGKSSLVCAIALGLGGEPPLLGRAINIGAFVKRGEESGYIKISLRGYTKEEKITIVRKIDTRNKSEWLYNGKSVPKREILEIMSKFNIQVNNLTQFLPQDRVCEFAKLTPIQLLEETEKAVGDPQLPLQHHALVERSRELKRYQIAVETMGESLKQLIALNAEQEKDVERIRQRNELLEKVDYMKKKLPWLKYDTKKTEYLKAQEKEKDAGKKLDEAAKTLSDFKAPIEKQKQEKAKLDDKYSADRDFLVKNLQPFDVPILNYVRDESGRKEPFQISEQMRELGIYSRLDQIFDAPTAVKEVLTLQFGLDRSARLIGTDDVAKLEILDFWTPENHYHWSVSRYGDKAMSATVERVGDSRLLPCGTDIGGIEKLKSRKSELESSIADLEGGLKSLQTEERLLEDEAAKLR